MQGREVTGLLFMAGAGVISKRYAKSGQETKTWKKQAPTRTLREKVFRAAAKR